MRVIALAAAAVMLVAGCSSGSEDPPAAASQQPAASTVPATVEESTPAEEEPVGLTAAEVLTAFQQAKLPVRHPRDNSNNCDAMQLGCVQLTTTDDVSIYVFVEAAAMENFAASFGKDAFVSNNVVLSYAGAKTPATMRPKYQAVLTGLG